MKRIILLLSALLALLASTQELPQFAYNNFEGWSYNGVELTSDAISRGRITLYVKEQGMVLTLTSPEFQCQGIDSIHADVLWKSASINIPLTMAIDDADGTPLDSVSCFPSSATTAYQTLSLVLPVPQGTATARLRFFSLEANVNNGGAVRKVTLTGSENAGEDVLIGDVDGNGNVSISDVTTLINYLLSGTTNINREAADIDKDGRISISDVTALINILLSGQSH